MERICYVYFSRLGLYSIIIGILSLARIIVQTDSFIISTETQLVKHLFEKYSKSNIIGRPVITTNQTLIVYFGISLAQILQLNEKEQILTTNIWCSYNWVDELIKWDPKEFGGVKTLGIPSEKLWTPDVVLYNYADTRLSEQRDALLVVEHNGLILWVPQAVFKSACPISITYFPFDVQRCHMKFGSWTYDGTQLDIQFFQNLSSVDISDYVISNEWEVLEQPAVRTVKYIKSGSEPYPTLTFYLTLKRKGGFFHYILVLPCILLSLLTLSIFWIPPESPAKVVLGMNIYVAFFVLLLLLAECIPKSTASIPLLGAYFVLNMILITLSTFLAIIVVNLYMRGEKKNRAPMWLKKATVGGIGRILCMKLGQSISSQKENIITIEKEISRESPCKDIYCTTLEKKKSSMQVDYESACSQPNESSYHTTPCDVSMSTARACPSLPLYENALLYPRCENGRDYNSCFMRERDIMLCHSIENEVKEVRSHVRAFTQRIVKKEERKIIVNEWRQCAIILDRFFFFCYVTANFFALLCIFPQMIFTKSLPELNLTSM